MSTAVETVAEPLHIAICGGGASAVLFIDALSRHMRRPLVINVIEPRQKLGAGVAYSTDSKLHLLNVNAGTMSGAHDPDAFLNWLREHRARSAWNWTAGDFVPRSLYGEYLQHLLSEACASPNIRLSWQRTVADSVKRDGPWEVVLAHGEPLRADLVVLATGNEVPSPLGESLPPQACDFVIDDPWNADAKSGIPRDAPVLIAGTSLTAVDVVVELIAGRGHTGPIIAFSRRGLLPRTHGAVANVPADMLRFLNTASVRDIVRELHQLAENDATGSKIRGIMRELRRAAPAMWARYSPRERKQFLRHVRPFWEAYRHRIAPAIHKRLTDALKSGQLTVVRGRMQSLECDCSSGKVRVTIRQRGVTRVLEGARLINCTGPRSDPAKSGNPLLMSLVGDRIARADPLGLGLATDAHSRVLGPDGSPRPGLFALGPLTRGNSFEATSVPEISHQVDTLAKDICRGARTLASQS